MLRLNQGDVPIAALTAIMITNESLFRRHLHGIDDGYGIASFGANTNPINPTRTRKNFE
jgi:hypothetical protein